MEIRKARLQDASNIYELVNSLSSDGALLHRAFAEICEKRPRLYRFGVGPVYFPGCGAFFFYGPHLAEVRSIVVRPEADFFTGGMLLQSLLDEAEESRVCVGVTRMP